MFDDVKKYSMLKQLLHELREALRPPLPAAGYTLKHGGAAEICDHTWYAMGTLDHTAEDPRLELYGGTEYPLDAILHEQHEALITALAVRVLDHRGEVDAVVCCEARVAGKCYDLGPVSSWPKIRNSPWYRRKLRELLYLSPEGAPSLIFWIPKGWQRQLSADATIYVALHGELKRPVQ